MRIFFLVPYPHGESPSQRFRFEQYFELLKQNKIEFTISAFWSLRAWTILYSKGNAPEKIFWLIAGFLKRWLDVFRSVPYDLIFIHRESAPVGPPVFEFMLAKFLNKKIIYDFDDAIWLPSTSDENALAHWVKFHGKVKFICRWSYRVSCGNDWLANYARQFNMNVVVNPTTIDTVNLHNPDGYPSRKENEKVVIGWTGTHSTLVYLNELIPVLQAIEKKHPVIIRIIANKNPNLPLQSFEFIPWRKEPEIEDLLSFDIGLMPLTDDAWANGKCGFKALQYMALSIPCVASAVGVNNSIIQNNQNGFLCRAGNEWETILEKLILDQSLRKRIGTAGKETVIQHYSVSSNSSSFLALTKS